MLHDVREQLLQIQALSFWLINDLTCKLSMTKVYAKINQQSLSKVYNDCHQLLKEEEEKRLTKSRKMEEDVKLKIEDKLCRLVHFMDLLKKETKDQVSKLEMELNAISKLEVGLEGWEPPIQMFISDMTHIVKPILEDIEFDPESAHPNLSLSPDLKRVRFEPTSQMENPKPNCFEPGLYILGRPGFKSGRHYWEVDVGSKSNWIVGVVRESVERKGGWEINSTNGYWVLRKQDDNVFYAIGDSFVTLSLETPPMRIGICLDLFIHRLAFYDADTAGLIFQLSISAEERLFPFFCPGLPVREEDWCPLVLCS
ncbi:zinc-binding protein A33-like [Gastrophryne carolinensis]